MDIDSIKVLAKDDKHIIIKELKSHSKASENYIVVEFVYEEGVFATWIPYVYRRAGLDIDTPLELYEYLKKIYSDLTKSKRKIWYKKEQEEWNTIHKDKSVTKPYFDAMLCGDWTCRKCTDKITKSSNNARRIQDIKEMGYQMSTNTSKYCSECATNTSHDFLIPLKRAEASGYETWSTALLNKIIKTLKFYDTYEDRVVAKSTHLIPDHKFPEIRWDENTLEINLETMTEIEINKKFQLLSNQRNLQKREVCRKCYQTGKRGKPFGINFFYKGNENWQQDIPKRGKLAEEGCVGCGWYDLKQWRDSLNNAIDAP